MTMESNKKYQATGAMEPPYISLLGFPAHKGPPHYGLGENHPGEGRFTWKDEEGVHGPMVFSKQKQTKDKPVDPKGLLAHLELFWGDEPHKSKLWFDLTG